MTPNKLETYEVTTFFKSLIQVYILSVSLEDCYGYVVFTTPSVESLTSWETQEEPYEKSLSLPILQPRKLILRQVTYFSVLFLTL